MCLGIEPENRCSPYDSDGYPYLQSVEPQIVAQQGGRIYSPYTGRYFASTGETDIEHIVARSEAHDSFLSAADSGTKRSFARDLLNLTLASPSVKRHQEIAKDVAEWLPAVNQCWYVNQVVLVKRKYNLSMDQAEATKAQQVLATCGSTEMQFTDLEAGVGSAAASSLGGELQQRSTRLLRRQRKRQNHLCGGAATRHRPGAAWSSRPPVYEGRRQRRRSVRMKWMKSSSHASDYFSGRMRNGNSFVCDFATCSHVRCFGRRWRRGERSGNNEDVCNRILLWVSMPYRVR